MNYWKTITEVVRLNNQLLGYLSNSLEKNNEEYWEELLNDDKYYHYIFHDDLNINNLSDADMQSNDEKLENVTPYCVIGLYEIMFLIKH